MTEQHRADSDLWAAAERWGANTMDMANCILELRSRLEALEATQRAHIAGLSKPYTTSPLVDQVACILANFASEGLPGDDATPAARTVLRLVAKYIRSEYPQREGYGTAWANLLDDQANR